MSKLPTFLSAFDKLLTGHPIYFTNSLLVVLSAGGEKIFQAAAFKCPEDPALAKWYGWIFLFAPIFILLVCGMVLNDGLWRVYHGCKKRQKAARLTWGHRCHSFWMTFFRSLIIPSAWLFMSLLDGTYIVCSMATATDKEAKDEEAVRIKAYSQMGGWIFLVAVVFIGTSVTCYIRCYDRKTFLELRYAQVYKKKERDELEKQMNETAQAIAQENVKSLFSENLPPKATWDKVTVPLESRKKDSAYYSSLHKWSGKSRQGDIQETDVVAETHQREDGTTNGRGDSNV